MTLIKRMAVGVLFMLLLIFAGTYFITLHNAREFFIKQLDSNAQDTATSLGLSLSLPTLSHDVPTISSMVQAIFDRGDFYSIEIKNMKGKILVSKKLVPTDREVPSWFETLIRWPVRDKTALIMDGWKQVAEISVTSDPSDAHVSLWNNAVEMSKSYVLFACIALILAYWFIQYLLRPLRHVTRQAMAISEREFPIEHYIPKAPELRQVTLAMNQMVIKLKTLFQEQLQQTELLRIQVYQDPLTGLANRASFLQQISAILDNEDEFLPGSVLMMVIDGLEELNQLQGYQQGDQFILSFAKLCKEFWIQPTVSSIARISGSTFAVISHEQDSQIFNRECEEFEQLVAKSLGKLDTCQIHMGAAHYFSRQSVSNLLTVVDSAVKNARENNIFYCEKSHEEFKYPQSISIEDIKLSIEQKNMSLYAQAVKDDKAILHKEIFIRIADYQGEEVGAGRFMPIAEKGGLAHLIDLYVLNQLAAKPQAATENFAINLSEDTLVNSKYREHYLRQLAHIPRPVLDHLFLEISESLVLSYFPQVKLFVKQAKKLGVKIGVDKVGIHFSPLHYLSDLHIDYLKLYGSLVHDIHENESMQFFIHYFNEMAKILDIQVVATQVENEEQWQALQSIHVPWGQGRYLGAVSLL